MHPGLRTFGLQGFLLLSRQSDVIDRGVVKSRVQEYWSQRILLRVPHPLVAGGQWLGASSACALLVVGCPGHHSELLPLDVLALDLKAPFRSHRINFDDRLPPAACDLRLT